jgi:hypothetical protein
MALIENIQKTWITEGHGLGPPWHKVEVAQVGNVSSAWFTRVPEVAYENELDQRNKLCRNCVLYSGSEGDFSGFQNLMRIIVFNRQCTGIYLNPDAGIPIPFRTAWNLEAAAPVGTFSKPDPRARCRK